MSVLLGQGEFKYRVIEDWAKLPENWSFMDVAGLITRLAEEDSPGHRPGQFLTPHGLSADIQGNIYVSEVSYTNWPASFGDDVRPKFLKTLQKLERIIN